MFDNRDRLIRGRYKRPLMPGAYERASEATRLQTKKKSTGLLGVINIQGIVIRGMYYIMSTDLFTYILI